MDTLVDAIDYEEASDEVREIYDDIMETRGIEFVPNFWRTIAHNPSLLRRTWVSLKEVMSPGALDTRTKEMLAIAVSVTNGCEYCIRSHTAAARKIGMTDDMLGELMEVVGMFNETNSLADGYRVEPDSVFFRKPKG